MGPIMEEIAIHQGGNVTVVKVDATQATVTAAEFGVKTYPTIKYYKDSRFGDYEGNKSFAALDGFVSRMHGSS